MPCITEHNFTKFNGCPRQAYLMAKMPNNASQSRQDKNDLSPRLKEVRDDMLKSFPKGMNVYGNISAAAEETKSLIKKGERVIYNASFVYGKASCRCDVIIQNGSGYDVYAVRPTNRYARWTDEVLYDRLIMRKSGAKVGRALICAIDKEYSLGNILKIVDVSDKEKGIADRFEFISKLVEQKEEPTARLEKKCSSCAFFSSCFDCGEDSIFSLKSLSFPKKASLYKRGVEKIDDLAESDITDEKTLREIKVLKTDDDVYDRGAIREFLSTLSYPLGFLDFETAEVFVPNDPVLSPMDSVITQFSYHLIEKEGGEAKHFEFIGDGETYPEREAAKRLIETVLPSHCVLMYSDYEKICIQRLMRRLPEYEASLSAIVSRLVDLEQPFAKKYLVNRRMKGKSSLKKVLPALYPGDRSLNYKYMRIQDGRQAQSVYSRLPKMSVEEKKRAMRDLCDYCALDTLAMIKLLEKLIYYARGEK
jgi:predicted RecB family nuclease